MAKLSSLNFNSQIKVCAYGNSGAGKTCFAAGFPGPIWVADFDGKISSAAGYLAASDPAKLDQIEFESFVPDAAKGGLRVFNHFLTKLAELEKFVQAGKFPFQTVVVDSLTTFSEALMQEVMQANPGVKRVARGVPAMQDYLIHKSMFMPAIQRLLALPCNVVATAHIKVDKDESTGEVMRRPLLSGSLPELLPILFEEVYHAFAESKDGQTRYLAQTANNGRYVARTQIPNMPAILPLSYKALLHCKEQKHVKKPEAAPAAETTPAT